MTTLSKSLFIVSFCSFIALSLSFVPCSAMSLSITIPPAGTGRCARVRSLLNRLILIGRNHEAADIYGEFLRVCRDEKYELSLDAQQALAFIVNKEHIKLFDDNGSINEWVRNFILSGRVDFSEEEEIEEEESQVAYEE